MCATVILYEKYACKLKPYKKIINKNENDLII